MDRSHVLGYLRLVQLAGAFMAEFEARGLSTSTDSEALNSRLRELHSLGERSFDLFVAPEVFAAFLGARVESIATLQQIPAADIYLACSCAQGNEKAAALFRNHYGPEIELALSQVPDAKSIADEIAQQILTELLVANERGERGISAYRGRGGLFSWLRVIAIRRAVRELKRSQRETPLSDEHLLVAVSAEPDLGYMKELYRESFRIAFAEAISELDHESRRLLRQHYVHGLSIDKLAKLYDTHRATSARRLAKCRETLLVSTRRRLLRDLKVDTEELDSIMRLIASKLEASIGALMSSQTGTPDASPT